MSPKQAEHIDGVLVIGGGYAGLHAAKAAQACGAAVTVLDPGGDHAFIPRLAAVAGGTAGFGDVNAPLRDLVRHLRSGRAQRVASDRVHLDDGSELSADAIVVTTGSHPTQPPLPGIEHTAALRTETDALALRSVLDDCEQLVILGGGPTGVQLAGSASVARPDLGVILVEMKDRLLSGMHPDLGRHAQRILEGRDVDVLTGVEVTEADSDGAILDDETIVAGLTVWAGGFAANSSILDAPDEGGRITVEPTLLVGGTERTFAAGDVAAHHNPDGEPLPMSAQIATQGGTWAGHNAAALANGAEPDAARLVSKGWVLDLGGGRGVAEMGPIRLAASPLDRLAPPLHWAIDARHLWQVGGLAGLRFLPGRR